jgi:hypothetical protein
LKEILFCYQGQLEYKDWTQTEAAHEAGIGSGHKDPFLRKFIKSLLLCHHKIWLPYFIKESARMTSNSCISHFAYVAEQVQA